MGKTHFLLVDWWVKARQSEEFMLNMAALRIYLIRMNGNTLTYYYYFGGVVQIQ